MAKTNAQRLDGDSPANAKLKVGSHIQTVEDTLNLLLAFVQLPKLLAQIDADDATTSNYAATLTPTNPGNVLTQFTALLAKLDADAKPAGSDYAALLTPALLSELPTKWLALLKKLDLDDNTDATYEAKNALPFVTTLNEEKPL